MTRLILLAVAFVLLTPGYSQSEKSTEISEKITRLQQRNEQLSLRIADLESAIFTLKNDLKNSQEAVKQDVKRGLELQAQSERAMNLALDGFTEKFEKQNETVKGVQEELSKKFNNQLVMFGLGFIALVIVFTLSNRSSTRRALSQNQANWNSFQEHLLKK